MRVTLRNLCAVAVLAIAITGSAIPIHAQQGRGGADATVTPGPPPIPLKVTVTISRFAGEKKTASLPFTLWVNTGGQGGSIRLSSDVPIPVNSVKDGVTTRQYTYRSLGTNIDCSALALGDGLFRVSLTVDDSQVFQIGSASSTFDPANSAFQNFRAQLQPILRDSQSVQFAVATDKTSGEVIKLDVTMNLVK